MARARARLSLPRGRRIRKRADFVRVQTGGLRVGTRHLLILLAAGASPAEPARLGVVASRKVGGAVQRNRAKRLVREAFRLAPSLFPAGVDVVVVVRASEDWAPGRRAATRTPQRRAAPSLDRASLSAEIEGVRPLLRRRAAEAVAGRVAAAPARPGSDPATPDNS